ncbi:MAG: hypothetical protein ABJZ55_07175 [Fuerstiella sp.]
MSNLSSAIYEVKVASPGISMATPGQKAGAAAKLIQTANHALLQRAAWKRIEALQSRIKELHKKHWGVLLRVDWAVYQPFVGPATRSLLGVYIMGAGQTFCEALTNQRSVLLAGPPPKNTLVTNWVWMTPLGPELWVPEGCR